MDGKQVANKLRDLGFSQAEIAKKMEIPPQNLFRLLSAKDMKIGTLTKIAKAAGRPIEYFLTNDTVKNCKLIESKDYSDHLPEIKTLEENIFVSNEYFDQGDKSEIIIQLRTGFSKSLANGFIFCNEDQSFIINRTYFVDTKQGLILATFSNKNDGLLSFEDYFNKNRIYQIDETDILKTLKVNFILDKC